MIGKIINSFQDYWDDENQAFGVNTGENAIIDDNMRQQAAENMLDDVAEAVNFIQEQLNRNNE